MNNKYHCNSDGKCLVSFDYYSETRFASVFHNRSDTDLDSFSIFHLNIRSLNKNYRSLLMLHEDLKIKFHVIVLSEIRANNVGFLCNIMNGYNFHYDLPNGSDVGGTGIFIKNSINYLVRDDIKIGVDNVESIWLEIQSAHATPIVVGGIYRHPGGALSDFTCALESILEENIGHHKSLVLAGDFNINLIKFQHDNPTAKFLDTMLAYDVTPTILMPTRFGRTSNTLIDHIYYYNGNIKNVASQSLSSGNIFSDISDHLPNFLIIKNVKISTLQRPKIRIFSKKNHIRFSSLLAEVDWDKNIYSCTNVDAAYNNYIDVIKSTFDKCYPLVTLSRRGQKDKAWFTEGLKKCCREKKPIV